MSLALPLIFLGIVCLVVGIGLGQPAAIVMGSAFLTCGVVLFSLT